MIKLFFIFLFVFFGFTSHAAETTQTIQIESNQIDLLISSILVCSCCIAWCIGWLCHEMGGK